MRPAHLLPAGLLGSAALLAAGLAFLVPTRASAGQGSPAAAAQAPAPVHDPLRLLAARPFVLDAPYVHEWRAERPEARAGYVLVLGCDPELVAPRQTAEPVLCVGERTAERVNAGTPLGTLVVVVPAPLAPDGSVGLDLATEPIWLAAPELPERVDAAWIAAQRASARPAPFPAGVVATALAAGGSELRLADRWDLDLELARIVEQASPTEVDLVRGLRVPRVRGR